MYSLNQEMVGILVLSVTNTATAQDRYGTDRSTPDSTTLGEDKQCAKKVLNLYSWHCNHNWQRYRQILKPSNTTNS